MKNFEMNCPVEGTSALQPKLDSAPARRARIIAFPQHAVLPDRDVRAVRGARTRQPVRRVLAETFPGPARPFHNPQMLRFCGCVAPPPPRRRVRSGVYAPLAAC